MINALKIVISSILTVLIVPLVVIRWSFTYPQLIPMILADMVNLLVAKVEYEEEE